MRVAPASGLSKSLEKVKTGDVVEVSYLDHVFYKDSDESLQNPRILTAYGLLVGEDIFEGRPFIKVRLESYPDPDQSGSPRTRAMGLIIVKSTILDIRRASA